MSTVTQAYRFALDPTRGQTDALRSHCGGARFAYNWALAQIKANLAQRQTERCSHVPERELTPSLNWSAYGLRKQWNQAKTDVAPWWADNSKEAYAGGLANLATALGNWKASKTGRRRGAAVRFPRFKSKRSTWSYRITTGAVGIATQDRRHVQLPRIGQVRTHESTRKLARHLERGTGRILNATVSYRAGRWQVSFTCEIVKHEPYPATVSGTVGVDLGVTSLAVLSTGETVPNPKHLDQKQRKLRRLQRRAARRTGPDTRTGQQPSNRWRHAQQQVSRLHTRVSHARHDGLHQLSTRLTRECDTIVVEDLNVAGMTRNRRLARHIADAGWGELRRQLTYKTRWNNRGLVVADRFYPSSKTCSACGAVKTKLRLSERIFTCQACGLSIDRDLNAARNLAALADKAAGSTSTESCAGTRNKPAGNPRQTTPSGGSGYRHGKTHRVKAASQDDGSETPLHVS